ncbi:MAG TPA: hypothetical protein VF725_07135 [Ktedonobacterales bacterium]
MFKRWWSALMVGAALFTRRESNRQACGAARPLAHAPPVSPPPDSACAHGIMRRNNWAALGSLATRLPGEASGDSEGERHGD